MREQLWNEYQAYCAKNGVALEFEDWLIARIEVLSQPDEPRGILLSVTAQGLGDHFAEDDLEYVTQEMLDEIADGMWNSDDDGWKAMYDQNLGNTISDNWQYWQNMIDAEKKRQQS